MELEKYTERKIYSVSEINKAIKDCLEQSFPEIWIQGEVSNSTYHSSGHVYFSIKDDASSIRCVMFRQNVSTLRFTLEDGLNIIINARLSAYIKRGEYQLICHLIEPAGRGALQLAFEQLKRRLEKEGLFDLTHKRTLPAFPKKIGIITSPTGAAVRDIISGIVRRYAGVYLLVFPVSVQGSSASGEIAYALAYLNEHFRDLDVVIVGRGGGSMEDLWAFNEEPTIRAIFGSRIPVISCVGHEIDYTIADFVADVRAPTPSTAAELAVPDKRALCGQISMHTQRMRSSMEWKIRRYADQLNRLVRSKMLTDPLNILQERIQLHDELHKRLIECFQKNIETLETAVRQTIEKLNILSPLASLSRGYAIARHMPQGSIIESPDNIHENDRLTLTVAHGEAEFNVHHITRRPHHEAKK